MLVAIVGLLFFWGIAQSILMRQDHVSRAERRRDARLIRAEGWGRDAFIGPIRDCLRPGFHPDNNDNYALASNWLQQQGLELG